VGGIEVRMINLTIDGIGVSVPETDTIIEAARKAGLDVPALCYDPCLPKEGACRICVVEVEGARSLMASCTTPVSEGMVVQTESEKVVSTRKDILRLLLDNHPNDCLTCLKAGECKLQEYAYRYDVKFREHDGAVRESKIDTSNPYIFRDDNKCILCGKCVRTCAQVRERSVLSFANRGFETRISADCNNTMGDSSCVSCARCVNACPVGALMDARAMKAGRTWELEKEAVKCTVCEFGCDFELLKKNGKIVGVRAQAPIEGRPLCLKGRISVDFAYNEEVQVPYVKKDGKFVESTWSEALGLDRLIEKLAQVDKK
jgi:formate dehydrogenase (NAD+, ferredoxin) subunit A